MIAIYRSIKLKFLILLLKLSFSTLFLHETFTPLENATLIESCRTQIYSYYCII